MKYFLAFTLNALVTYVVSYSTVMLLLHEGFHPMVAFTVAVILGAPCGITTNHIVMNMFK